MKNVESAEKCLKFNDIYKKINKSKKVEAWFYI
jgi:hypothetical protein